MEDKEIIIDGVDVSGCKYWKGFCRIASLCDYPGHLCEVTPNCNYKNWKRKEQECERLTSKCSQLKQGLTEIKSLTESEEYVGFWEDCLSEIGRKASEVLDE